MTTNALNGVSDALRALAARTTVPLAQSAPTASQKAPGAPDAPAAPTLAERIDEADLDRRIDEARARRRAAAERASTPRRPSVPGTYSHHSGGLG